MSKYTTNNAFRVLFRIKNYRFLFQLVVKKLKPMSTTFIIFITKEKHFIFKKSVKTH